MKNHHSIRSYLAGVLTALMVLALAAPALAAAAQKTIQVSSGVRIYIDDAELRPTDANGNPVEVFVYNGTTYLPVRAVSEGLGKPVQWDGGTRSVYIGKHTSDEPAEWLANMDYFSGTADKDFKTAVSEKDNNGDTHYNCITTNFDRTYNLDGQYSLITGTMYQKYERRSWTSAKNTPNCIEIYGDGRLLYTHTVDPETTGIDPIDFSVDLTGVLQLRVYFSTYGISWPSERRDLLSLGDVALWS